MLLLMTACSSDSDDSTTDGTEAAATETTDDSEAAETSTDEADADADAESEESTETAPADEANGPSEGASITKTIDGIDDPSDKSTEPIQIGAINLYDDGSVEIIPTDELAEIELRGSERKAIYPFEEFGKAKNVYVLYYGDDGYRTVIALMEDGTIAAVNSRALVEDHVIAVAPNLTGRDDYKSVKNKKSGDSYSVIGVTTDGDQVDLDNSLNLQ